MLLSSCVSSATPGQSASLRSTWWGPSPTARARSVAATSPALGLHYQPVIYLASYQGTLLHGEIKSILIEEYRSNVKSQCLKTNMVSSQLVHGGRLEKHFGPGWGGRDSLCNTRGVALEGQEERPWWRGGVQQREVVFRDSLLTDKAPRCSVVPLLLV